MPAATFIEKKMKSKFLYFIVFIISLLIFSRYSFAYVGAEPVGWNQPNTSSRYGWDFTTAIFHYEPDFASMTWDHLLMLANFSDYCVSAGANCVSTKMTQIQYVSPVNGNFFGYVVYNTNDVTAKKIREVFLNSNFINPASIFNVSTKTWSLPVYDQSTMIYTTAISMVIGAYMLGLGIGIVLKLFKDNS